MCGCQAVFQSSELGRKKGPAEIISMLVNGMETKSRLCICMFADEIEGFRFLDPAWILNPSEGRGRSRIEKGLGNGRPFFESVGGVQRWSRCPKLVKKRKEYQRDWWRLGLASFLDKSAKYHCEASGRIATPGLPVKVLRGCFQSPLCCGLWGLTATRCWKRRLAGWLQGLSFTCGGIYSSLQRWSETGNKNNSSLWAAGSQRVALLPGSAAAMVTVMWVTAGF